MILIVAESTNGKLAKSTLEMAAAARQMGRTGDVTALVLGSGVAAVAAEAAKYVDQVLVGDLPTLAQYNPELWAAAVAQIAREGEATAILIGGSRSGREFSPRVAVKLDAPLLEDVIAVHDTNGTLTASHYTFLARVTETLETSAPIAVITVKPGAFAPAAPLATTASSSTSISICPSRASQSPARPPRRPTASPSPRPRSSSPAAAASAPPRPSPS